MKIDKILKIFLVVIVIVAISACGKSENGESQAQPGEDQLNDTSGQQDIASTQQKPGPKNFKAPVIPEIREVKFVNKAIAGQDLQADPHLSIQDPDVVFNFRWFVNDREVSENVGKSLPADFFKVNDWIHCRVIAEKQNRKSRMVKSNYIKVLGAAPILKPSAPQPFSVPGTFLYTIQAFDPTIGENIEVEENRMRFELLAPLDVGIELDSETGEMKWELDEELVDRLGKSIEIKYKVTSFNKASVISSVTLKLSPQKEESEKQQKEGTESF